MSCLREQRDGRGEGMQEVLPAHRSEFSVAEEPRYRDLAQHLRNKPGIVVRLGEQPRSAAGAGEQQGPGDAAAAEGGGLPLQDAPEIGRASCRERVSYHV